MAAKRKRNGTIVGISFPAVFTVCHAKNKYSRSIKSCYIPSLTFRYGRICGERTCYQGTNSCCLSGKSSRVPENALWRRRLHNTRQAFGLLQGRKTTWLRASFLVVVDTDVRSLPIQYWSTVMQSFALHYF